MFLKGKASVKRIWLILIGLMAISAHGRTWTSTSGTSLEADYVSMRNNTVTLRKADGKLFEVGLQFLSAADRAFVSEQKASEPAAPPAATVSPATAPAATTLNGGAKPASNGTASAFGSSGPTRKDLLTDEQIAVLKTEIPGKKEGEKFIFTANASQRQLDAVEKRKFKNGDIPFRITAEFLELSMEKGKQVSKRMSGYVRFYVLDEDGKIVVSRRDSLDKMCPT